MNYSDIYGPAGAPEDPQFHGMTEELRNGLWNVLFINVLHPLQSHRDEDVFSIDILLISLLADMWGKFYKRPYDLQPRLCGEVLDLHRDLFMALEWYKVYDLLEFIAQKADDWTSQAFRVGCNQVFEEENAGCRFVMGKIVNLGDSYEAQAVDTALSQDSPSTDARRHLNAALKKLSNRDDVDVIGCMEEAISAVESAVRTAAAKSPSIPASMNSIDYPYLALRSAVAMLNGDASIIRLLLSQNETKLTEEDASYMLVSCSALVNYILGKVNQLKR